MVRRKDLESCKNRKVILGECLTTQHRILILNVRLKNIDRSIKQLRKQDRPGIKWWNLKGEAVGNFKNTISGEQWTIKEQDSFWIKNKENSSTMYERMANHIKKKVKEELGMTKGRKNHIKETW